MRIIVACERTQRICQALRRRGHDAYSCDIEPTDGCADYHFHDDIFEVLKRDSSWDMMIAHPECTYLSNSGVKHLYRGGA